MPRRFEIRDAAGQVRMVIVGQPQDAATNMPPGGSWREVDMPAAQIAEAPPAPEQDPQS